MPSPTFCNDHDRRWWSSFIAGSVAVFAAGCAVALMWAFGSPLPVAELIHVAHPHHQGALAISCSYHSPDASVGMIIGMAIRLLAVLSAAAGVMALLFVRSYIAARRKAGSASRSPAISALSLLAWAGVSALAACTGLIFLFAFRRPLTFTPGVIIAGHLPLFFSPVWPIGAGLATGIFAVGCVALPCPKNSVLISQEITEGQELIKAAPQHHRVMRWLNPGGALASLFLVALSTLLLSGTEPDWIRDVAGSPALASSVSGSLVWGPGREVPFAMTQWLAAPLLVWGGAACALLALAGEIWRLAASSQDICPGCRRRLVVRSGTAGVGRRPACGARHFSVSAAVAWVLIAAIAAVGVVLLFERRFYWNPGTKSLIWWPILLAQVLFSLVLLASGRVEWRHRS